MSREEFLAERRRGIGGSDSGAICRVNKWRNPVDVYLEKIGEAEETPDNIRMQIGRALEGGMLNLYEEVTGQQLSYNPGLLIHPKHDFLLAHVDGIVENSHVVEIKVLSSPHFDEWGEPVEDGYDPQASIPISYYYQLMHYLMVTGLNEGHMFAFLGGFNPVRLYKFKRDPGFIARMRADLITFWRDHVVKRIPPRPMTQEEVKLLFPLPKTDKMKEANVDDELCVNDLKQINEEIKQLQSKKKEAMDALTTRIGPNLGLKITNQEGKARKLATFNANKNGHRTFRAYG